MTPKQMIQTLLHGDEAEKEAAAERLMALGAPVVPDLETALQAGDQDARWWAARALAGIKGPEAARALLGALQDPDEDVRVCAILGLGERRELAAVEPLLLLMRNSGEYARRHIGDALSKIGEPAAPALIATLGDEQAAVRAQAARALVRIESHDAIPALIAALDDPSAAVEHYAWEALQRMGVGIMVYFQP